MFMSNSSIRYPIHHVILIAASKYFTASLGPYFQEANHDEFILDDTDGETLKMIVDFCYSGRIDLTEENVGNILAIASSVQLDFLEEKCRQYYDDHLNVNNSLATLLIAEKYSYPTLRKRALDYCCEAFELIPSTEIQKFDHSLLEELLKRDNINATEESIFNRLMDWFNHSEVDRAEHMPELIKLIRLKHFSPYVSPRPLVSYFELVCRGN